MYNPEGLLRKYKISKIVDTIKLSDLDKNLCDIMDKKLIGLTYKEDIHIDSGETSIIYYGFDNETCIMRFDETRDLRISVNSNIWNTLREKMGLSYNDVCNLIKDWMESIYGIKINTIGYTMGINNKVDERGYEIEPTYEY